MTTLHDLTARLGALLDNEEAASDALNVLGQAMRAVTIEHAKRLRELGPVRVLALDPCPCCGGTVIASETDARCRCGWSYRRLPAGSVLPANELGGASMNSYDRPVPEPPNG